MLGACGRRGFCSAWRSQFRSEWRLRLQTDAELAECYARLHRTLACRAIRFVDRSVDRFFIGLQERLAWPSSAAAACPLAVAVRPLSRPAQFLDTLAGDSTDAVADGIMARRIRRARLYTETHLVGPIHPPWASRLRYTLRSALLSKRQFLADLPLLGTLFRRAQTRTVIQILRDLGPGPYLTLPTFSHFFEHQFLPRMLKALSAPNDPVNEHWLRVHCAEPVRKSFDAMREAPQEFYGVRDQIRYLGVIKCEWKGSFMSPELRECIREGEIWDASMDTPDLIYLVTLRAVSDLASAHEIETSPREIVCSMAVSLLDPCDASDPTALEVKEVSILSNESLVV